MTPRTRASRRGLVLVALALCLALPTGGCARRAAAPPTADPPRSAPVAEPPAPPPAVGYRYPPYLYHVEGSEVHLVAVDFGLLYHRSDYWFIGADPVTIEIRFAEAVPDPADAIRQIRQTLPRALIHEEGHEADRVFVKASLPPGRYTIALSDIGVTEGLRVNRRVLTLDRGWPFRLLHWAPGGIPEVLGDCLLPHLPLPAALGTEREEAFFATIAFDEACLAVEACLWRWQPGAQPPVSPLSGLWSVRSMFRVWAFPRGDDLVIQTLQSLLVVDSNGQLIATLAENRYPHGAAVGPGGEIAVFLVQGNGQGGLDLSLTIFSAALETHRTWGAIYPQGRFSDGIPEVQPIWHGDEILFLALDDHQQGAPTYHLMAFDVTTGSVRRILGPIARGHRVGRSHYALLEHDEGAWALFDAATASLRILPSARELGSQSGVNPVAVNADWVVFSSESGLLAWRPSTGVTRLGPGRDVVTMGEGFLWWTEIAEGR